MSANGQAATLQACLVLKEASRSTHFTLVLTAKLPVVSTVASLCARARESDDLRT
jgi:hypothetical protein